MNNINEKDFDKKDDSWDKYEVSHISLSDGVMNVSLTGGVGDFFMKSAYKDDWVLVGLKGSKEENMTTVHKRMDEVKALVASAKKDMQDIADAYLALMEARMRKLDAELLNLKDKI